MIDARSGAQLAHIGSGHPFDEVTVFSPRVFSDDRGWLMESWHAERYAAHGVPAAFPQDNVSFSRGGVLRGLHYQSPNGQAKLVSALAGEIWDVGVDVRLGSPTFGRWFGCTLSAENRRQLHIPDGFAHGFIVLSDSALVHYKCSAPFDAAAGRAVLWSDPDLGIAWPARPTTVSATDTGAPRLRDMPAEHLASRAR
jgi:dTDP-4-dehydrorhamnose 3,5-epimerase